jgi:hypothetical protein
MSNQKKIIKEILKVSDETLSDLMAKEGYTVQKAENREVVRQNWKTSQECGSPNFDDITFAWNYFKRSGLFPAIARDMALREKV